MKSDVDVIVIGAGINGLAAAAYLGRAGRKVLVLEGRAAIGGLAAAIEFHPRYRSSGVLSDTSFVRPALVRELGLERYGLGLRAGAAECVGIGEAGRVDLGAPQGALTEPLADLRRFFERIRGVLAGFCDELPIDVLDLEAASTLDLLRRGLRLRRLGRADMLDLLRIAPMCLADWLTERLGRSELADIAAAALAVPALTATYSGSRSPGGGANLLLLEAMRGPGTERGAPALADALAAAARDVRVEIKTGARVASIDVEGGIVRGVTLATGESISAAAIASSCDPRTTLLDLVAPLHVSARLTERLENYRCRGTTAQLLVATNRSIDLPERCVLADGLDDVERAFDRIKYRQLPTRPVLDVTVASKQDLGLCPPGHAVLSALVNFVPPSRGFEWSDEAAAEVTRVALARLGEHIPNLADSIVATALATPADLARDYGLAGGNLHHGERAIDQILVRPVPECSVYSTPIGGLFLCGQGSHPGGGLHGGSGRLAARVIAAL